ncbi:protein phosphatase 2C domain-containing protein [Paenibacillus tianjinensis]|uniref:Protein phosphatase 2C domain-containing protein n=1 Tax=Paenibacillus tianjinensis TaxID=2810347 RepID=A0ABX7LBH1_9BACL|nr:protein phosphatase 2C domain-containing protein [Paenibacillus tianjinensis]QSF44099.1 protein phosphatase 2C domain-containing protein [Paenibacillus tianjinensis]
MDSMSQWKMETYSLQGDGEWNEDSLVVNESARIYGVVDGATSLSPYRNQEGFTGGYLAARLAATYFTATCQQPLELTAIEANERLREAMEAEGVDITDSSALWSAAYVIIKVHAYSIDYIQSGDCMLLCRYRDGSVRALTHTQVAHIDQKTLNRMAELHAGGVTDPVELRRLLTPMLQDNRRKANTLEGYGVMNGSPDFPLFLEKGTFNRANVESLYLISDGLFTGAAGWESLIADIDRKGLQRCANDIYAAEQEDAMLQKVPRLKISDDKTGLVLRFI